MSYYAEFKIVKPLYSMKIKVSALNLKVGDRFVYHDHDCLLFKTNAEEKDGKILCCDDSGRIEWIDKDEKF